MNYDVAIAYRICPRISGRPPVFQNDKLRLAELCVKSLKAGLGTLRAKVWVLLDNCPPEYERLFTDLWDANDLVLIRYPGIGNRGTFMEQIRVLATQTDATRVFFAEDDYLYLPAQMQNAVDLLDQHKEVDFITPYDHPDYYSLRVHRHKHQTIGCGGHRWRTVATTTCTFLTRQSTLVAARPVLESYYRPILFNRVTDNAVWLSLTKHGVFNPFNIVRYVIPHRFWAWGFLVAWAANWRHILFGRRMNLWAPKPSLATHMLAGLLGVGVDWSQELRRQTTARSRSHLSKPSDVEFLA